MSPRAPRVHVFVEPELAYLVTRCDSIADARAAILADTEALANHDAPDEDGETVAEWLDRHDARVESGRVVNVLPALEDHFEGCAWTWVPTDRPGPGVTTAVVWGLD